MTTLPLARDDSSSPRARPTVRVGVVVPSVNTMIEPLFSRVFPTQVNLHAARMFLEPGLDAEAIIDMDRTDGVRALRQLASCRCQAIAYCCTASSVVGGPDHDRELLDLVSHEGGAAGTTVTESIASALRHLQVARIVIASPYAADIDEAEARFFAAAGFTVLASRGLGIRDSFELSRPSGTEIYQLAKSVWTSEADALVLTCANFRSHEVIESLEADLGRPVVTATQAPLWRLLRLCDIGDLIPGLGQLLRT